MWVEFKLGRDLFYACLVGWNLVYKKRGKVEKERKKEENKKKKKIWERGKEKEKKKIEKSWKRKQKELE